MNGVGKNNNHYYELIEGYPDTKKLKILIDLYSSIFEDARITFFKERLANKENVLSIIAYKDKYPVGFKIGYKYSESIFYSWVGGILENVRNQGFASNLAINQENWARKKGSLKLRTKSMNRFKTHDDFKPKKQL